MCNKNNPNKCETYRGHKKGTIVIKQGYVLKEASMPKVKNQNLTHRGYLIRSILGIYKPLYDVVKSDVAEVYNIINKAQEDTKFLEIQDKYNNVETSVLRYEIKAIAEDMCLDLSHLIVRISQSTYEKVYESIIDILSEESKAEEILPSEDLEILELYDKINTWLGDLKSWLLDNINASFENSLLENKSLVQKGLFSDIFENIKNTFEEAKAKVESVIRDTILNTWTMAEKIAFKIQRVESYQIVFSGHPNACEECESMADEHFNIADLKIGVTAPPFHPHCGCRMMPYNSAEKEGSLWEQLVIAANVAFELLAQIGPTEELFPPFYDFVKSAISAAGNYYLQNKGWTIAKELFNWGMYGKGMGLPNRVKNMLIEELKNSNILKEKIREYTKNGQDFDLQETSIEFKPNEANLHYSVQNAYLWLEGKKLDEQGKWQIYVKLKDQYDFTQFRNSLAFTDLANNLGEAMQ
ncbi:MAG: minor capsid protein [Clostridia bacterium]|nr:minor capsid protein [Clostridia bacterium]